MDVTLSIDEQTVEAARRVAREQGTTLNELIRCYIAELAEQGSPADRAREILALFEQQPGDSRRRRVTRKDAYEGRL